MKMTEYTGKVFNKNGEEYTRIAIGSRVTNTRIEKLAIAFGGKLIKSTSRAKYYEVKGNRLDLFMFC